MIQSKDVQTFISIDIIGMMKKVSKKTVLLSIILVAVAGFALHLFYNRRAGAAGSKQQELDRLFGNIGIL